MSGKLKKLPTPNEMASIRAGSPLCCDCRNSPAPLPTEDHRVRLHRTVSVAREGVLVFWCLSACIVLALTPQARGDEHLTAPRGITAGGLWGGFNKTYDGQRYSPLHGINKKNVSTLKETCRVKLAQRGAFEAGPVVIDTTLFVTTSLDTVALDPTNCAVKWKHTWQPEQNERFTVNRGVAYLNGRVFRGTADGRLLALDAATGKLLWTDVVGDPDVGEYVSSAPIAWNGLVFIGTSGSEFGIKGRIMAYDATSGREVWR